MILVTVYKGEKNAINMHVHQGCCTCGIPALLAARLTTMCLDVSNATFLIPMAFQTSQLITSITFCGFLLSAKYFDTFYPNLMVPPLSGHQISELSVIRTVN